MHIDPAEELAALYHAYTTEIGRKEYAGLRRAPDPGDAESARVKAELPPLATPASAVAEAVEWWLRYGDSYQGFARMHRLHHLLRKLNHALATVASFRIDTRHGVLSLGSPWWATYWREKHAATGGMPGELRFSMYARPFTNIRLLPPLPPVWAWSQAFAARATRVLRRGCQGRRELRVGLCVLGRVGRAGFSKTDWLDKPGGLYGFRADAVTAPNGASAADELVACVRWARESQVHVLCFPELAIDAAGREVLLQEIADDPGALCLVVPGSFHERADNPETWVNRAPVWLVEDLAPAPDGAGPRVRVRVDRPFDKTDPFIFKAKKAATVFGEPPEGCIEFREDIDAGTTLTVVDSPAGRFGLAICKDAMNDPLLERYGQVADHLLVVSMNEQSTSWFWNGGETLARRDAVAAFYVNSAQDVAVQDDAVDLAFWCFPEQTGLWNVVHRRNVPPAPAADAEAPPPPSGMVPLPERRAVAAALPPEYAVYAPVRIPGTVLDT